MSIPAIWKRTNNPYAARFYGSGLGWTVLDYRGRKVCYHSGSSGTMFAIIPEENLGVVVLTNQEWSNLSGMLMYDVFDAYLLGPKKAWDRKKWAFWKKADPHPDLKRQEEVKEARAKRKPQIQHDLPLANYAGSYGCDLYGDIIVTHRLNKLQFQYGKNQSTATHWQGNTFYLQQPVPDDSHVDWLVTFEVGGKTVKSLSIKRLGWHEALPRFVRREKK